jgi:hypothetical protein
MLGMVFRPEKALSNRAPTPRANASRGTMTSTADEEGATGVGVAEEADIPLSVEEEAMIDALLSLD